MSLSKTSLCDPVFKAVALSLVESVTLTNCRGLYIGVSGDLVVDLVDAGDDPVMFENVPVGIMPLCVAKVYSSSTVDKVVALY
jgi:hypothetical protein